MMPSFTISRVPIISLACKHVVIIEDDSELLYMLDLMLTDAGYGVTAYSEPPPLEDIFHLKPDCFILDEGLPYISGHIICMLLKAKPETKDIPVILTSAGDQLEYMGGLSESDAMLQKPFDEQVLLRTVGLLTGVM